MAKLRVYACKQQPHFSGLYGAFALTNLSNGLQSVGWPSNTPIALIENATTTKQKVITSTLELIVNEHAKHNLQGPTLIMIGEVINHKMAISPELLNCMNVNA